MSAKLLRATAALLAQGFTHEQAMTLLAANPVAPTTRNPDSSAAVRMRERRANKSEQERPPEPQGSPAIRPENTGKTAGSPGLALALARPVSEQKIRSGSGDLSALPSLGGVGGLATSSENKTPPQPLPAKPTRARPKTAPPGSDGDPQEVRAWLAKWSLPPLDDATQGDEVARFLDRNRAQGGRYADWGAAWRTWMANARKWAAERSERSSNADPDLQGPDGLTDAERKRMRHRGRTETPPPAPQPPASVLATARRLEDTPVSFGEAIAIAKGMGRDPHEVHAQMEQARLASVASRDAAKVARVAPEGSN